MPDVKSSPGTSPAVLTLTVLFAQEAKVKQ
jgi:hypothetical protein